MTAVSTPLSENETQRLRELVAQGLTASEVAKQIGRGRDTVRVVAKRLGLVLTHGKSGIPGLANVRPGKLSGISARAPRGSLVARRQEAKLPEITIRVDVDAHKILDAAARHRRKSIEKLAADIIEGTVFLGSIPQQEAKAFRYRTSSTKERISNRDIADIPAEVGEV